MLGGVWKRAVPTIGFWLEAWDRCAYFSSMRVDLPLKDMSFTEKLELMETIWDDLSREPAKLPSPEWHREVLEERRAAAEKGEGVSDWAAAKEEIRRRVS
jgi:hypothetical protein